jgi:hypothetical protein
MKRDKEIKKSQEGTTNHPVRMGFGPGEKIRLKNAEKAIEDVRRELIEVAILEQQIFVRKQNTFAKMDAASKGLTDAVHEIMLKKGIDTTDPNQGRWHVDLDKMTIERKPDLKEVKD